MHVIVDKKNPFVAEVFKQFGKVTPLGTKDITKDSVHDADILVVRSETKVGPELLDGSAVKFVGTATIGTDHVDLGYLRSHEIGFASAPGSNANSVAEYVVAALLTLAQRKGFHLKDKTIGVVGVGNVGSKVARNARALGMTVLENDPPLFKATGDLRFLPLDELMKADVITVHVPFTKTGADPTYHLFDNERLKKMKKGSILINTSRGSVVDGTALLSALVDGHLGGAVLDVWENEPAINVDLLLNVEIGTPHIAGYSFDGKLAAVRQVYQAACKYFGEEEKWEIERIIPKAAVDRITFSPQSENESEEDLLLEVIRQCYDIETDDRSLRAIADLPFSERGAYFRRLRTDYGTRREFFNTTVEVSADAPLIRETLSKIGFQINNLVPAA
jgi:erythronate-4-phosphate dehydrogenase